MQMDNLQLAAELVRSALAEKKALEGYTEVTRDAETYEDYLKIRESYPQTPTKASINNKIKVARKLLVAAYME